MARTTAARVLLVSWLALPTVGHTQAPPPIPPSEAGELITLDFQDTELTDVINMISKLTKRNFLFDDRVRGRVTVISPSPVTPDEAYRVFEAILQVKGFTTVEGPGGILKIVPTRQAKESPIETVPGKRTLENRDLYITRLLGLRFVRAETIISTLRPLVSSEANLIGYAPTNTLIITDTSANIRRLVEIIDQIDIATHQEQIRVIPLQFASAAGMTGHLREIFAQPAGSAKPATTGAAAARQRQRQRRGAAAKSAGASSTIVGQVGQPRFIPDERTNSIIVLAPQTTLAEVERLVSLLDYERKGTGRIHVYRLQNADAEEMAQTLASLVQGAGARRGGTAAGQAAGAAAVVANLGDGIRVTADAPTNSLIIQASAEGYSSIQEVIRALDIRRPQVLVEVLIMEVNVDNATAFEGSFLYQNLIGKDKNDTRLVLGSDTGGGVPGIDGGFLGSDGFTGNIGSFTSAILGKTVTVINPDGTTSVLPVIQGILTARATDDDTNIISAPVILTADNEEATIIVGENIPIPTTRLQTADTGSTGGFQTSLNIERQDVGVTLRVTPQISEGDTIRLQIFQEISQVLSEGSDLGPTTSRRTIENTVYVRNGEAVMIGGILSETESKSLGKVPFLGDIPIIGWAFKSRTSSTRKTNLLVIMTPHIIRDPGDLEQLTLEQRERFRDSARDSLSYSEDEEKSRQRASVAGLDLPHDLNPVRRVLRQHEARYPPENLPRLQRAQLERERERLHRVEELKAHQASGQYRVQVAFFNESEPAVALLGELIESGYDGIVLSRTEGGQRVHLVQIGPYTEEDRAQHVAREIQAATGRHPIVIVEP